MKIIMPILLITIFMYIAYTMTVINNAVTINSENIKANICLLTSLESVINQIQEEQNRRTKKVYSIPYILNKVSGNQEIKSSCILKTDTKGIIIDASDGIEKFGPFNSKEAKGISISTLMSPENWNEHKKYLAEYSRNKKSTDFVSMNRIVEVNGIKCFVNVKYIASDRIFIIDMREE